MEKTKVTILIPDAVVVKQRVEKITEGGLIVPKEALYGGTWELFEGIVVAKGELVTNIKVGDHVSFGKNSFSIKKWRGEEYFYLHATAIHTVQEDVDEDYECESESDFLV